MVVKTNVVVFVIYQRHALYKLGAQAGKADHEMGRREEYPLKPAFFLQFSDKPIIHQIFGF